MKRLIDGQEVFDEVADRSIHLSAYEAQHDRLRSDSEPVRFVDLIDIGRLEISVRDLTHHIVSCEQIMVVSGDAEIPEGMLIVLTGGTMDRLLHISLNAFMEATGWLTTENSIPKRPSRT